MGHGFRRCIGASHGLFFVADFILESRIQSEIMEVFLQAAASRMYGDL